MQWTARIHPADRRMRWLSLRPSAMYTRQLFAHDTRRLRDTASDGVRAGSDPQRVNKKLLSAKQR